MPKAPERPEYTGLDEAAIAIGLGLVLLGVLGLGLLETFLGTSSTVIGLPGLGVIPVRATFAPHVRASLVATGFSVLFVWGLSRFVRALVG